MKLLRVKQWYKNVIIFIPLVFSLNIFNTELLSKFIIGFFSLCAISSSYYIINDIIDRKHDRLHAEKRKRPIAAGKVSVPTAIISSIAALIVGIFLASLLNTAFIMTVITMFIYIVIYSVILKKEAFLDMIIIALNFVIRTIAGIFILEVNIISPWILSCTFFLALLLVSGKRRAEMMTLKDGGIHHRKALRKYSIKVLDSIISVSTSFIILAFALYAVWTEKEKILLSLPIAMYALMIYLKEVYDNSAKAQHPELFLTDKRMLIGVIIWIIVLIATLYW